MTSDQTYNFRNCAGTSLTTGVGINPNSYVFWVEYGAANGFAVARSRFGSRGFFEPPQPLWATLGATPKYADFNYDLRSTPNYVPDFVPFEGVTFVSNLKTSGSISGPDSANVVGISFDTRTNVKWLYATTTSFLYGCSNPIPTLDANGAISSSPLKWSMILSLQNNDMLNNDNVGLSYFSYQWAFNAYGINNKDSAGRQPTPTVQTEFRGIAMAPRACSVASGNSIPNILADQVKRE